ncbi:MULTISPECIES: hypothetical protein [unclassified Caballeronia]|uniref:hypothetical protein n=1 Tax=unclassified Caballeronia TaxID=2646786 RepID=UPI0028590DE9|nr:MULTISPECIES: hypothetical protein [unclassified Caballeronia]MDR5772109.1 hypothetical protein [Caballeronia sp. LZ002]MDR5847543.1 hypothetical protein [Caballeronia sp. LZ003]
MKRCPLSPEDIVRILEGGRRLSITQIAARLGRRATAVYGVLPALRNDGRIHSEREKEPESGRKTTVYFTARPQPVAPPYPSVLLEGSLVGYGRALRQHADLCLVTRR